jgi:hypothetical protein
MYKIRKFLGLTLFEDAIADITEEDKKNFKKQNKTNNDWVTPTSFTGI